MKKYIAVVLVLLFFLSGCGAAAAKQEEAPAKAETVEKAPAKDEAAPAEAEENGSDIAAGGSFTFSAEGLSADVTEISLVYNGMNMQLLARIGDNGAVALSWNTCQVCNGSPYAYFEHNAEKLTCKNCGNSFPLSSIGATHGGCYPWPVSEYTEEDGTITIPSSVLEEMVPNFKTWKKGL